MDTRRWAFSIGIVALTLIVTLSQVSNVVADDSERKHRRSKKVDMSEIPPDIREELVNLRFIREHINEDFKIKRTLHFSIIYDTSEEDVSAFAAAIEKTYRACMKVCMSFDLETHPPKKRLLTHFFNEQRDYLTYTNILGQGIPPGVLGHYAFDTNYSYFYNQRNSLQYKQQKTNIERQISQLAEQLKMGSVPSAQKAAIRKAILELRREENRMNTEGGWGSEKTLQHEVAHHLLFNIGFHNYRALLQGANPRWLSEGMAMLFEPVADGNGSGYGKVNPLRLPHFTYLVKNDAVFPVAGFVSDPRYFSIGNPGAQAYPQAWATCHYLTRTKKKEFIAYLKDILKRDGDFEFSVEKELELFEKHFGKVDKRWEKRFMNFMKNVRA